MRIFLVDDEKEIADLIEFYLRNDGFEVIKCMDGKTALQKIHTESASGNHQQPNGTGTGLR